MNNYYNIKCLNHIYLEDSFVISILESESELIFNMEFVLCESHELYLTPKVGERYCYKSGKLVFSICKGIRWLEKNIRTFISADGTLDYGNIDSFLYEDDLIFISGDWGEVELTSKMIKVEFI